MNWMGNGTAPSGQFVHPEIYPQCRDDTGWRKALPSESINLRPCLMFFYGVLPSSIIMEPQTQLRKRRRVTPMSLYYKFVAVHQVQPQNRLLTCSSSPRWLGIRFFSKALVGEHRALSFLYDMAMILTPPCSPDVRTLIASTPTAYTVLLFTIQMFSNMRSYKILAVLALAASTTLSVPLAVQQSAPVQFSPIRMIPRSQQLNPVGGYRGGNNQPGWQDPVWPAHPQPNLPKPEPASLQLKQEPADLQLKQEPADLQLKQEPADLQLKQEPADLQLKQEPADLQLKQEPEDLKPKKDIAGGYRGGKTKPGWEPPVWR
jgi:Family of unknown function (DUF6470)